MAFPNLAALDLFNDFMTKQRIERILGIDPGLQAVGFGVIDAAGRQAKMVDYGAIKTNPRQSFPERLFTIFTGVEELIEKYKPDRMVFEKLIYCKNVSIALSMGQARGAVIVAGARHALPMSEYSPAEIKSAITGQGRASKEQVQKMMQILLSMSHIPEPDHAADALAAALTYVHSKDVLQLLQELRR
ncbi:MAG: crossover junction endodeoxyribonuclease RuvC [Candidatus Omnitrophota bacterium]